MNQVLIKRSRPTTEQSGFTLVEILVTVLILAVGSLGIASLQLAGLKYTSGSYARTQAVLLADDMANRIKSNRAFALDLQDDGTFGPTTPYLVDPYKSTATSTINCLELSCTNEELANHDLDKWLSDIARVLPAGQGRITLVDRIDLATGEVDRQFNIGIQWRQVANSTSRETDDDDEVQDFTFRISI